MIQDFPEPVLLRALLQVAPNRLYLRPRNRLLDATKYVQAEDKQLESYQLLQGPENYL